jgi:hypothetical protein
MGLKDYENKHKGKLAFVAGAGPSLHFEKLEGIDRFVTFAVNSAVIKLKHADYFVTDDEGVTDWDYFYRHLPAFKGTYLLYENKLRPYADSFDAKRTVWFEHKTWFDLKTRTKNPDGLVITDKAEEPIIGARTSAGTAVHLAHIMGCSPIVLLGCDCCMIQEKNYFWQFPGEYKPHRLKGYAVPSRRHFVKGKVQDDHSRDFLDYWKSLQKANPWMDILDASKGLLDCFPKITYQDAVVRYAKCCK